MPRRRRGKHSASKGPTTNPSATPAATTSTTTTVVPSTVDPQIVKWVTDLALPERRAECLIELSKIRESIKDLGPLIWHAFGALSALLMEITSVYPQVLSNTLTLKESYRTCNALALLQCVAGHDETRKEFFRMDMVTWLMPFLKNESAEQPYVYVRLTTMGIIGSLIKVDDSEIIGHFLEIDVITICLRIMKMEGELSKTVATFILQRMLSDEKSLDFVCSTYEKFSNMAMILGEMVIALQESPSERLYRHIVRCYLRLSYNIRAREALRGCMPDQIRDYSFNLMTGNDMDIRANVCQILQNLGMQPKMPPREDQSTSNAILTNNQEYLNAPSQNFQAYWSVPQQPQQYYNNMMHNGDNIANFPPGVSDAMTAPSGGRNFTNAILGAQNFMAAPSSGLNFVNAPGGGQNFANAPGGGQNFANVPGGGQNFVNVPGSGQYFANAPGGGQNFANGPGGSRNFANAPGVGQNFLNTNFINTPLGTQNIANVLPGIQNIANVPSGSQNFVNASPSGQNLTNDPSDGQNSTDTPQNGPYMNF